jgi:predicted peroxiredoxin
MDLNVRIYFLKNGLRVLSFSRISKAKNKKLKILEDCIKYYTV